MDGWVVLSVFARFWVYVCMCVCVYLCSCVCVLLCVHVYEYKETFRHLVHLGVVERVQSGVYLNFHICICVCVYPGSESDLCRD